jgi:uncharacterized membrane protein YfcA
MELSIESIIIINSIIVISSVFQMVTGISVGMIIVPILAFISYSLVPTPIIFASIVLTIFMAYKYKKHICYQTTKSISIGMLLGIIIALIFFTTIKTNLIGIVFGVMILLSVLFSIKFSRFELNNTNGFWGGLVAGTMGAISAVGGQVLAMLMQNKPVENIKATLSFLYTLFSIVMLIIFAYFDKFSLEQAIVGIYMMPGFLIGFLIGPYFIKYLNPKIVKPLILWLASIGALLLIVKSLF